MSKPAMIPYSLTKRPTPIAKTRPKRKAKNIQLAARTTGEDSDSDGEPTSFFSLERADQPVLSSAAVPFDATETSVGPALAPKSYAMISSSNSNAVGRAHETVDTAPSAPKPFTLRDEPIWTYDPEVGVAGGEGQPTDHALMVAASEETSTETSLLPGVGPGLSMDERAVSVLYMKMSMVNG